MNQDNLLCKSCGGTTFTKGEINSGYAPFFYLTFYQAKCDSSIMK